MAQKLGKHLKLKFAILIPVVLILTACGNVTGKSTAKPFSIISSSNTSNQSQSNTLAQGKVGGGIIGSEIGVGLDGVSRDAALEAEFAALEKGRPGEAISWANGQNASGTVIPQQTYEVGSQTCRRYTHQVIVNGESRKASSTSCRQPAGTWQILS